MAFSYKEICHWIRATLNSFELDICKDPLPRLGFPHSPVGKESGCNAGDLGSIPELGRSPGEGNGNPLQYSCLENPMDRGAFAGYSPWGRKSRPRLSD